MREKFPKKKPGDALSARHINRLGVIAERVSGMTGDGIDVQQHGTSINLALPSRGGVFIMIVTDTVIGSGDTANSGLYLARMTGLTTSGWVINDLQDWVVDARPMRVGLSVGDVVSVVWSTQAGVFLAIEGPVGNPYIDAQAVAQTIAVVALGADPDARVEMALELSFDGASYFTINDRTYSHSIQIPASGGDTSPLTITGIYTFAIDIPAYLRVRSFAVHESVVTMDFLSVRVEAKGRGGIQNTLGAQLGSGASTIGVLHEESLVRSQVADLPKLQLLPIPNGLFITPPTGEVWTFEAEISAVFSALIVSS